MTGITKKMILACKGMTRMQCANHLQIKIPALRYLIGKYEIIGFFKMGTPKQEARRVYYKSMIGVKTPEQIADDLGILLESVRRHIRGFGLNKKFGITEYGKKDGPTTADKKIDEYSRRVEVKCHKPGCTRVFVKNISTDCLDGKLRMPRFFCSICSSNEGRSKNETL